MQSHKVHMSKKQFRIGDLADELKVKKFVIRFWEKEFNIKSDRSGGGQRFYTSDDLRIFLLIKDLLYKQGFTIAGAKKQLHELLASNKIQQAELTGAQEEVANQQPSPDEVFQAAEVTHEQQEETIQAAHLAHPGGQEAENNFEAAYQEAVTDQDICAPETMVTPATTIDSCQTCNALLDHVENFKNKLQSFKDLLGPQGG